MERPRGPALPSLLAVAGLSALVLFLFRDAVFRGQALFDRDIHLCWYEHALAFRRALAEGSWPTWDPYRGFGQPQWANPSFVNLLYPVTWLHLVLPPWTVYTVAVVLHLTGSAAGAYFLGRRLGLSPFAAFVTGALWVASGPFLSLVNMWNQVLGAAWIPWIALAADRAFRAASWRSSLAWGAAWAAPILTGSAESVVMGGVLAGTLALPEVDWRRPRAAANRRLLGRTALALGFALLLAAGQWVPTVEVARRSERAEIGREAGTTFSLHPVAAFQVLAPFSLFDVPAQFDDPGWARELGTPLIGSVYLGAGAAGLVAAALLSAAPLRRLLTLLFAACLLVALGHHAPFFEIATVLLPPLRGLRFPSKAMVLAALAWALLAGFGADVWRSPGVGRRRAWWLVVAALGLALALGGTATRVFSAADEWGPALANLNIGTPSYAAAYAPVQLRLAIATAFAGLALVLALGRRRWEDGRLAFGLGALAVLDLVLANGFLNPTTPPGLFVLRPRVLEAMDLSGLRRVHVWEYDPTFPGRAYRRWLTGRIWWDVDGQSPGSVLRALGLSLYLYPHVAPRFGLYGSFADEGTGLASRESGGLRQLFWAVEETPASLRLLRMAGVDYVVALHDPGLEGLRLKGSFPGVLGNLPIQVYDVTDPLPRAYAVDGVRVARGPEDYRALTDPRFDLRREVVLAEGDERAPTAGFQGRCRIRRLLSDRVVIEAELSGPGQVVLLDTYDPGWSATVDGRSAPVVRANLNFRAVPVGAGTHLVELVYRPRTVVLGTAVSLLGLLGAVLVTGKSAFDRRRLRTGGGPGLPG
jgi:membrane protein YfhO